MYVLITLQLLIILSTQLSLKNNLILIFSSYIQATSPISQLLTSLLLLLLSIIKNCFMQLNCTKKEYSSPLPQVEETIFKLLKCAVNQLHLLNFTFYFKPS